jgi:hypothetical protein
LLAGVGLIQSGYDILIRPECQPLFQEFFAGIVDSSRGEVNHLIDYDAQSKICCTYLEVQPAVDFPGPIQPESYLCPFPKHRTGSF